MLFSEPKIPQCGILLVYRSSSKVSVLFSEPKIPQFGCVNRFGLRTHCFSALQRAENSSIPRTFSKRLKHLRFQCSSASRKFLNSTASPSPNTPVRFSALQRAENSSIVRFLKRQSVWLLFQCSSASRKFLNCDCNRWRWRGTSPVSVLFSEPKIPQLDGAVRQATHRDVFQCSSASRKFLNPDPRTCVHPYFRPR